MEKKHKSNYYKALPAFKNTNVFQHKVSLFIGLALFKDFLGALLFSCSLSLSLSLGVCVCVSSVSLALSYQIIACNPISKLHFKHRQQLLSYNFQDNKETEIC